MKRIEVEGRLGNDVELKTWNGNQFISFRVAVSDKKDDDTMWFTVTGDYERYKNMMPYLKKGSGVNIVGTYSDGIYTTRENKPMIDRKIRAYDIRFASLGQGKKDEGTQTTQKPVQAQAPQQPVYQQPAQPVYQTPQGVQQPIQQPVYQQPAQPVYQVPQGVQPPVQTTPPPTYQQPAQQPVYQQPVAQPAMTGYQPQENNDDLPF